MDKLRQQDKTRAKFSTLDWAYLFIPCKYTHTQKQPNLKLKTQPEQLSGFTLLTFVLPDYELELG